MRKNVYADETMTNCQHRDENGKRCQAKANTIYNDLELCKQHWEKEMEKKYWLSISEPAYKDEFG